MLSNLHKPTTVSCCRQQQARFCRLRTVPLPVRAASGAAATGEAAPAAMQAAAGNGTAAQQQHQQAHMLQRQPLPEVVGKRVAIVKRKTKETSVEVRLNLDGTGQCVTNTPVGFFNHMLDQIASHGLFDVYVEAEGDTWIDDHHTVEDIALALGSAFSQALGDRKGIHRCVAQTTACSGVPTPLLTAQRSSITRCLRCACGTGK